MLKSGVATIVLHHLIGIFRGSNRLVLRLPNWTDNRWRRNLCGATQNPFGWPVANHWHWFYFGCHTLLVDIFHMGLQVSLLFKFLLAEVATILVFTLSVDPNHVSTQTALALELFEADIAVIVSSLMVSLNMHVSATI